MRVFSLGVVSRSCIVTAHSQNGVNLLLDTAAVRATHSLSNEGDALYTAAV